MKTQTAEDRRLALERAEAAARCAWCRVALSTVPTTVVVFGQSGRYCSQGCAADAANPALQRPRRWDR